MIAEPVLVVPVADGAGAVVALGVETGAGDVEVVAAGVDAGAAAADEAFGFEAGALEVAGVELVVGAALAVGAAVFKVSEPADVPVETPPVGAVAPVVTPEALLVTGVELKPLPISAASPAW